jgi:hypothetical protein
MNALSRLNVMLTPRAVRGVFFILSCAVAAQCALSGTALQGAIPVALGLKEPGPTVTLKIALVVLTVLPAVVVVIARGARRSEVAAASILALTGTIALPLLWLAFLTRPNPVAVDS